jgi:hypothetical protein
MPLTLCVGAASRRVAEEAAKLRVAQVVASRRQVGETQPGYTGLSGKDFAATIRDLSGGATMAVRDHGGPYQNGDPDDDWTAALDADADNGFGALHLDVSLLPRDDQAGELVRLCARYADRCSVEVGGERDEQHHLDFLLDQARHACQPFAAIGQLGGCIWADRQAGGLIPAQEASAIAYRYNLVRVALKGHNLDWAGGRRAYDAPGYANVAPEFGNVEVEAWLRLLPFEDGHRILSHAYYTRSWERWFADGEGTEYERARCALRYHLDSPEVAAVLRRYDDSYVRQVIAAAIRAG